MPELLSRREIGLSSAGVKTNGLIAKHVHTRGFVHVYTYITLRNETLLSYDWSVKTQTGVGSPQLSININSLLIMKIKGKSWFFC